MRNTDAEAVVILVGESGAITRGIEICWRRANGQVEHRRIEAGEIRSKNSPNRIYWNEPTTALLAAFCIARPLADQASALDLISVCRVGANQARYEGRLGATLSELSEKKWFSQILPGDVLRADRKQKMMVVVREVARRVSFVRLGSASYENLDAAELGSLREQWSQRFSWSPPQRPRTEGQGQLALTRLVHPPSNDQPDPAAHGPLLGARRRSLATLVDKLRLSSGGAIRILIQGSIGTGKTRLAFELFQSMNRPEWAGRAYDAIIWLTPRNFESYPAAEIALRRVNLPERTAELMKRLLSTFAWTELAGKVGLTHRDRIADLDALGEILEQEFPRRIFFVDNVASDLLADLPFFRGADIVITSPFVHVAHRSGSTLSEIELDPAGHEPLPDDELQGLFDPGQTAPLPPSDLARLREFSRRVHHNPLALVEFGFRARHVAPDLQTNEARYFDDSSLASEVGAGESHSKERMRDTYAGRWRALMDQLQRDLKRSDFEQLKLAAMFCPKAIPTEQIRAVSPGFAPKSSLQELLHRRMAQLPHVHGKTFLSLTPFLARTIRRKIYAEDGKPGLVSAAEQAVKVLMEPFRGNRPAEKPTDPEDDQLINSHLAVLLRCFEIELVSPVENVGRLVRHCCFLLEHRLKPLHNICRSVCPDFPNDGIGVAKTLLARHAAYLGQLEKATSAIGTGRQARARQQVLAWERARNFDEQAVAALAQADHCTTEADRTTEYRRARDFDDQAVEAITDAAATFKRRTGKSSWIGLNLRRWCTLTHTAGASDLDLLQRSMAEIEVIIGERHGDLSTEKLGVMVGRNFRWPRRLPGMTREQALHYLADDYLALALVARQAGDLPKALESLQDAWRVAREKSVRKLFPIPYALTAAVLLLTAHAAKKDISGAKRLVTDSDIQNAARKLLLSADGHWRFSRMQNVQKMSTDLDQLGIL